MKNSAILMQGAIIILASLALSSCQTTDSSKKPATNTAEAPSQSCEKLRASSLHQSRPAFVKQLYPDALYVGRGTAALDRASGLKCGGIVASTSNGGVLYRP